MPISSCEQMDGIGRGCGHANSDCGGDLAFERFFIVLLSIWLDGGGLSRGLSYFGAGDVAAQPNRPPQDDGSWTVLPPEPTTPKMTVDRIAATAQATSRSENAKIACADLPHWALDKTSRLHTRQATPPRALRRTSPKCP